jgi:hypothetical protein
LEDADGGRRDQQSNPLEHEFDLITALLDLEGLTEADLIGDTLGHPLHHEEWPGGEEVSRVGVV